MQPTVVSEIFIKASRDDVWDALTNPAQTKKYMFGCETVSDWKEGSSLIWKMMHEGKEFIPVKGVIKRIDPPAKLIYTVFDPHSSIPDIPENYLDVTYELTAASGGTRLVVTQGDFTRVENGEKRYLDAYNNGEGWNPILVQVKDLLENRK